MISINDFRKEADKLIGIGVLGDYRISKGIIEGYISYASTDNNFTWADTIDSVMDDFIEFVLK